MSKPHVLHGWHLSYYSGKTRAYLRYKNIPFDDHAVDAITLMRRIPARTGATVMPVVVTPDGEWLQDTTHIVDVLEQKFPDAPVLPATPRQRFVAELLEMWADEWWIPTAMHYRWSFPENYVLFEADAGDALLPGFPRFAKNRLVAYVASKLRGYLPSVGVVPAQFVTMERWTEAMLDALDQHFTSLPFLLGSKPSIADFALLGPLYGHLGRDPYPKRTLLDPRPHLQAWVERMNAPKPGAGEFLAGDEIPVTLRPLFNALFGEFWPMLAGIRDEVGKALATLPPQRKRLPRALGTIEFPMGAARFRRDAMPYTLWMFQQIQDHYAQLDGTARASVDAWLHEHNAADAMKLEVGVRLKRAGLHVMVER